MRLVVLQHLKQVFLCRWVPVLEHSVILVELGPLVRFATQLLDEERDTFSAVGSNDLMEEKLAAVVTLVIEVELERGVVGIPG